MSYIPHLIPEDISAETLLRFFPGEYQLAFGGTHNRGAYFDMSGFETHDEKVTLFVARSSLYNALPEYMFHPIDRFDNIPEKDKVERFREEIEKQELEKERARKFFAPFDELLLNLRADVQEMVEKHTTGNKVLIDIICDRLTPQQKSNKLIKQVMPFIPHCKIIRGNRLLLTLMLRKILMKEGLVVEICEAPILNTDAEPSYSDGLNGDLGDSYLGNAYMEDIVTYKITYWPEEESQDDFFGYLDALAEFRLFVQDYFLSIEHTLVFEVVTDGPPLRLSDDVILNYLGYNANI